MEERVLSSPKPANPREQIDAASASYIAGYCISFGCTRQDPLSSIAEDPRSLRRRLMDAVCSLLRHGRIDNSLASRQRD
jgi:hypothetical protein